MLPGGPSAMLGYILIWRPFSRAGCGGLLRGGGSPALRGSGGLAGGSRSSFRVRRVSSSGAAALALLAAAKNHKRHLYLKAAAEASEHAVLRRIAEGF